MGVQTQSLVGGGIGAGLWLLGWRVAGSPAPRSEEEERRLDSWVPGLLPCFKVPPAPGGPCLPLPWLALDPAAPVQPACRSQHWVGTGKARELGRRGGEGASCGDRAWGEIWGRPSPCPSLILEYIIATWPLQAPQGPGSHPSLSRTKDHPQTSLGVGGDKS